MLGHPHLVREKKEKTLWRLASEACMLPRPGWVVGRGASSKPNQILRVRHEPARTCFTRLSLQFPSCNELVFINAGRFWRFQEWRNPCASSASDGLWAWLQLAAGGASSTCMPETWVMTSLPLVGNLKTSALVFSPLGHFPLSPLRARDLREEGGGGGFDR